MESRGYLYTALSFNSTKQSQRDCFPTPRPPPQATPIFPICQQLQPFLAGRLMTGDAVTCHRVESGCLWSGIDAPCEMSTWPFLQECTVLEGSTKGALLQGLGGLFPGPVWYSRSVLKGSNSLSRGRSVSQPRWGVGPLPASPDGTFPLLTPQPKPRLMQAALCFLPWLRLCPLPRMPFICSPAI